MYLFCYGTRPEMIKMFPLINKFKEYNIQFKTLFSGQHKDLFEDFKKYLPTPDYVLNTMEKNQSLNNLSSKIFAQIELIDFSNITHVIVQGDTTTAYIIAMSVFNKKIKVIHLEAGLRTNNKYSPFPEEMNRCLISKIADIHLCPTWIAVENLRLEGITKNVYLVGNTVVDAFNIISTSKTYLTQETYLVTLHRRENRDKIYLLWDQLNEIAKTTRIIYLVHPSLQEEAHKYLHEWIIKLNGVNYEDMVDLIKTSKGIITDSGGIQEEAVCAGKKVLVCRDTTERPETIESGWGKLIGTKILENLDFLNTITEKDNRLKNPYGKDVCEKIVNVLFKQLQKRQN
jgi:UDP-N-acetylglucosamine 2-epimerase (non-hydrolysing)